MACFLGGTGAVWSWFFIAGGGSGIKSRVRVFSWSWEAFVCSCPRREKSIGVVCWGCLAVVGGYCVLVSDFGQGGGLSQLEL